MTPRRGGLARLAGAALATGLLAFAVLAPAHADEQTFTAGSGAGSADVFGLNIPYGGANIGFGLGESTANYFENNAAASAQSIDPAFLALSSILKVCGQSFPIALPNPTTADTNQSGGKPDMHNRSSAGGGASAANESAKAYPNADGIGDTTGAAFAFGGLVQMAGGSARSEARLQSAQRTRTASTDVTVSSVSLLDGLVQLAGMRWHLQEVVSGADSRSHTVTKSATFSIAAVKLAGLTLPTATADQLRSTIGLINNTTRPLGLQIRLPQVTSSGTKGFIFSPMTIALGGATSYGKVLYPLIAGTSGLSLVNIFNKLAEPTVFDPTNCRELGGLLKTSPQLNTLWNTVGLYTPIIVSAFAAAINGGAEVDVDIGGSRTSVDDTYFPPRSLPPLAGPTGSIVFPSAVGTTATGTAPTAVPVEASPPSSTVVTTITSAGRIACRTTSPVGSPGCWKGAGPVAAGLAGAVTLGLLGTDELWRRRRLSQ
ncbi:MAG TPA: hypothetical protein VNY84_12540, partial [Acidimicrobiales bacterium]|nr:hypothetical protein [Acidimicrobiales bacterium]